MKYLKIFTFLFTTFHICAQDWSPGEKRFKFAEGTLGFDFQFIPQSGSSYQMNGTEEIVPFELGARLTPRFYISGMHFWGHADFYINLPIVNILPAPENTPDVYYNSGPETGMKIYPWALREGKMRPYAGISWNLMQFNQSSDDSDSPTLFKSQAPLQFGISYHGGNKILELGGAYNYQGSQTYYLSRATSIPVELPPLSFSLAYRWTFDTSIKDAKDYDTGVIDRQVAFLRSKGKLNDISFAIGLSSSLITGNSLNEEHNPYSEELRIGNSHLDLGIGYYYEKWDAHANLSYRNIPFEVKSYDFSQKMRRRTIGLELYKFLFDYHGFVPYLGIVPSRETTVFTEVNLGEMTEDINRTDWRLGYIFGWDIRQDERQWYILRTNLRYFPIKMDVKGKQFTMNQFEFNFIQFVYYPGRHKWIKRAKREIN